jgi:hypothetical protein
MDYQAIKKHTQKEPQGYLHKVFPETGHSGYLHKNYPINWLVKQLDTPAIRTRIQAASNWISQHPTK